MSGILSPITAYLFIFIAIQNAPWFSWTKNALSDLGAVKPSQIYFNIGLILAGILMLIFTIGLNFKFKSIICKIGALILTLDAISLIGIGIFHEKYGRIHLYFSIAFFILYPIGSLIIGGKLALTRKNLKFGVISILTAIAAIATWTIPWKNFNITGVAIPEALSSLFASTWSIYTAIKHLK